MASGASSELTQPESRRSFRTSFEKSRAKAWARKANRIQPHKSFHRSYREDYVRDLKVSGLIHHAASTFRMIFSHWRTFLPLLLLVVIIDILFVGLMSEETYVDYQNTLDDTSINIAGQEIGNFAKAALLLISTVTSGGLTADASDASQIFTVITFLIMWLVTIYLIRHYLVGHKPKLRDALYNAGAPIVSTFCVFFVIFLQLIPIFVVVITYSAAIQTDFLSTPFYALIYFIFAALMVILSAYLLSSSVVALIAVTAPGLYPLAALRTASNLMQGRRIRFLIRLIYLIFLIILMWIIVMLPIILLDLALKSAIDWLAAWPVVPFFLALMTSFTFIYSAAYLYLYYRRMLDYDNQ